MGGKLAASSKIFNILCFSHLRWNFVYQRPQHVLSRLQSYTAVHFWEEPVSGEVETPQLKISTSDSGVRVLTPMLPSDMPPAELFKTLQSLLDDYIAEHIGGEFIAWYYTPMALCFSDHLRPEVTVYDCMDELSAFLGAPPELVQRERQLFDRADVVFAGGASLHSAKRKQHPNVHLFPSSVDKQHFGLAREPQPDPEDQRDIPHPRIGFFGVLDERLDTDLLRRAAADHPEWQFVLIGPVVKIRDDQLPREQNIRYLGKKEYRELPAYLANWDMAMLPFARNASTQFISPTKTPEYLAAGKRVVSTPIHDVVTPYGELGLVAIARDAQEFGAALKEAHSSAQDSEWLLRVDRFLSQMSWDHTVEEMWKQIESSAEKKSKNRGTILVSGEKSGPYV